jgi:hypothetical protein
MDRRDVWMGGGNEGGGGERRAESSGGSRVEVVGEGLIELEVRDGVGLGGIEGWASDRGAP